MNTQSQASVYPSLDELMPPLLLTKLPASLVGDISSRYETLGEKYLTDNVHTDGRRINGMMYTSRVMNCIEEVVDAVFCILGWIFKAQVEGRPIPDSAYPILTMLIDSYTLLSAEVEEDLARVGGRV